MNTMNPLNNQNNSAAKEGNDQERSGKKATRGTLQTVFAKMSMAYAENANSFRVPITDSGDCTGSNDIVNNNNSNNTTGDGARPRTFDDVLNVITKTLDSGKGYAARVLALMREQAAFEATSRISEVEAHRIVEWAKRGSAFDWDFANSPITTTSLPHAFTPMTSGSNNGGSIFSHSALNRSTTTRATHRSHITCPTTAATFTPSLFGRACEHLLPPRPLAHPRRPFTQVFDPDNTPYVYFPRLCGEYINRTAFVPFIALTASPSSFAAASARANRMEFDPSTEASESNPNTTSTKTTSSEQTENPATDANDTVLRTALREGTVADDALGPVTALTDNTGASGTTTGNASTSTTVNGTSSGALVASRVLVPDGSMFWNVLWSWRHSKVLHKKYALIQHHNYDFHSWG